MQIYTYQTRIKICSVSILFLCLLISFHIWYHIYLYNFVSEHLIVIFFIIHEQTILRFHEYKYKYNVSSIYRCNVISIKCCCLNSIFILLLPIFVLIHLLNKLTIYVTSNYFLLMTNSNSKNNLFLREKNSDFSVHVCANPTLFLQSAQCV